MIKRFVFTIVILLSVAGCQEETRLKGAGKYGMMNASTPEGAAMLFFTGVYEKGAKLDKALGFSTPKMQRLLKSYHTPRSVQRHVLNLTYDDTPQMQVDSGDNVGRTEFSTKASVSIFFTGFSNGDKIDDLRSVEMVKINKVWKVDAIKADKYL